MVDEDLGQHRHGEEQQREDTEEAVVGDQRGLAAAVVIAVFLHDRVGKAKQAVPALNGVGPRQQPGDHLTGLGGSPRPEPVKSQGPRSGRSGVRGRRWCPASLWTLNTPSSASRREPIIGPLQRCWLSNSGRCWLGSGEPSMPANSFRARLTSTVEGDYGPKVYTRQGPRTSQCQASSLPDESGSQRSGGLRNARAD